MPTALETALYPVPPPALQVRQAVFFDWVDGPREGICELSHPPCAFRFEILAERLHDRQLDDRLFLVDEIPLGVVDQVIALLKDLGPPSSPTWVPVWSFESDEEQRRVEDAIEALLAGRTRTRLLLRTADMITFREIWIDARVAAPAGA